MVMLNKKWTATAVALALMLVITAGCGGSGSGGTQEGGAQPSTSGQAGGQAEEKVVTVFESSADVETYKKIFDDFEKATGIHVNVQEVPGNANDLMPKVNVSVQTGDDTDVIPLLNSVLEAQYMDSGWLLNLNDLIKKDNFDADKTFGKYLVKRDGNVYFLPIYTDKWAVFYNKKLFDAAGVPYPKDGWTWDDYIKTAKKLTNPQQGVYGSYMLGYINYMYFYARQQLVPGYKPDGSSNYDDPRYKEALKFFGDLGNTYKIQPSWQDYTTKKMNVKTFFTGKYAMLFTGTFFISNIADKKNNPRDFNIGMAEIPVQANGKGNNNFGIIAGYGVNKNAKHPENAYQLVKFLAENYYKYSGDIPARVDLTGNDLDQFVQTIASKMPGDITADDYTNALLNDKLGYTDEKIVGEDTNEYNDIIKQEGELYLTGQKSLDDAVAAIKQRADKAIAASKQKQ